MRDIKKEQKNIETYEEKEQYDNDGDHDYGGGMDLEELRFDEPTFSRMNSLDYRIGDQPEFRLSRGVSSHYGHAFPGAEMSNMVNSQEFKFFKTDVFDDRNIEQQDYRDSLLNEDYMMEEPILKELNSKVEIKGDMMEESTDADYSTHHYHTNQSRNMIRDTYNSNSARDPPSYQPYGKKLVPQNDLFGDTEVRGGVPQFSDLNPCNCNKSQCLKLYCTCFARGWPCSRKCSCKDCVNTVNNREYVNQIRLQKLARKTENQQENEGFCSCKMSFCEKSYCKCIKNGQGCNEMCKCFNCKNPKGRK